ncbi:5899_t:CDS:2 [Funneliformis mosseae]|uniref:5899_t:CDS:1 n=1 Tax=Funneliformis mosseae TaxID=27381 RepID=A0A9N9A1P3_FUNMO|nr:5899_t:CDS:2 [Funneliformis mosseae]
MTVTSNSIYAPGDKKVFLKTPERNAILSIEFIVTRLQDSPGNFSYNSLFKLLLKEKL